MCVVSNHPTTSEALNNSVSTRNALFALCVALVVRLTPNFLFIYGGVRYRLVRRLGRYHFGPRKSVSISVWCVRSAMSAAVPSKDL